MTQCFIKSKEAGVPREQRMTSCAAGWKKLKPEAQIVYKQQAEKQKADCLLKEKQELEKAVG